LVRCLVLLDTTYGLKQNRELREKAIESGNVGVTTKYADEEIQQKKKFRNDQSMLESGLYILSNNYEDIDELLNNTNQAMKQEAIARASINKSSIKMRNALRTIEVEASSSNVNLEKVSDAFKEANNTFASMKSEEEIAGSIKTTKVNFSGIASGILSSVLSSNPLPEAQVTQASEIIRRSSSASSMTTETKSKIEEIKNQILDSMKAGGSSPAEIEQTKKAFEDNAKLGEMERKLRESEIESRKKEIAVINERYRRDLELNNLFAELSLNARSLNQSFDSLQSIVNPTSATKISTDSASQLSNLSQVIDPKSLLDDISASIPNAAFEGIKNDVGTAINLQSRINNSGVVDQIFDITKGKENAFETELNLESSKKSFKDQVEKFFGSALSTAEIESMTDKYGKLFEQGNGLINPESIRELLSNTVRDRFQNSISKSAELLGETTDRLNQFSDGLSQASQLNQKIYQSEVKRVQSIQSGENRLNEILTGKSTSPEKILSDSAKRQSIILGKDSSLIKEGVSPANNAKSIANEIISEQIRIADTDIQIKKKGLSVSSSLLRDQENNKSRLDRLNEALQEQIDIFAELKSASEEVISTEKQRSEQLRQEALERITKPLEERVKAARAFAVAQNFLSQESKFAKLEKKNPQMADAQRYGMLTAQFVANSVNPQYRPEFQAQQELVISTIKKIAEGGGAQADSAKKVLDKIAQMDTVFEQGLIGQAMIPGGINQNQFEKLKAKQPELAAQLSSLLLLTIYSRVIFHSLRLMEMLCLSQQTQTISLTMVKSLIYQCNLTQTVELLEIFSSLKELILFQLC